MTNNNLTNTTETKKAEVKAETINATTASPNNIVGQFDSTPMDSLILAPLIAAAQGQQELSATSIDNLQKLAYTPSSTETTNWEYKTGEASTQARAMQEPPSEDLAKLTSLLNQANEPISE